MLQSSHLNGFILDGSFSPRNLTNLEAWYRSDRGIDSGGIPVALGTWEDLSGNGRDLTESTNKPKWSQNDNQINHAVVAFDGTNDILTSDTISISQPFHVFVIVKNISPMTDLDRIYALGTAAGSPSLRQQTGGGDFLDYADGAAVTPDVATDTTDYHLCSVLANGTSTTIAMDDATPSGNANNFTGTVSQITLGARGDVANFGRIDIAEFALYSAEISGEDLTNLKLYFNNRYRIW